MIITDEKLLRVKCSDVLPNEVSDIRRRLELELKRSYKLGRPGIGLSAVQIGIPKNMAIVRMPSEVGLSYNVDLVNCNIAEGYDRFIFDREGCLSFPDLSIKTLRFGEVRVVDNLVEPKNFVASGLFSVCIQHELDHMRGILLPDLAIF